MSFNGIWVIPDSCLVWTDVLTSVICKHSLRGPSAAVAGAPGDADMGARAARDSVVRGGQEEVRRRRECGWCVCQMGVLISS